MSSFWRQLFLLVWKNLKIRATHCCTSGCELIFPVILTVIIGCLICSVPARTSSSFYRPGPPVQSYPCQPYQMQQPSLTTDDTECPTFYHASDVEDIRKRKVVYAITIPVSDPKHDLAKAIINRIVNAPYELSDKEVENVLASLPTPGPAPPSDVQDALRQAIESGTNQRGPHEWVNFPTVATPSETEKNLELCFLKESPSLCRNVFAAVVITNVENNLATNKFTMEYKIRIGKRFYIETTTDNNPVTEITSLRRNNNTFTIPSTDGGLLAVEEYYVGDRQCNFRSLGLGWKFYCLPTSNIFTYKQGFIHLQTFIDRGLREYIKDKKGITEIQNFHIALARMPFKKGMSTFQPGAPRQGPATLKEADVNVFGLFTSTIVSLCFSLPIFSVMRVNSERSTGFKEFLKMHGVSSWIQWISWLLSCMIVYFIWTGLIALFLTIPLGEHPNLTEKNDFNGFLFWMLLFLFATSVTTFSFFFSVFFQKVWTAVTMGLVIWIIMTALMNIVSLSLFTQSTAATIAYMLMPPNAYHFGYAMMITGGGRFDTMFTQVNEEIEISLAACYGMLILDNVILMTLAMYLDNIIPSQYGVPKSPLYIFRASEWQCGKRRVLVETANPPDCREGLTMPSDYSVNEAHTSTLIMDDRTTNPTKDTLSSKQVVDNEPPPYAEGFAKATVDSPFEPDPLDLIPTVIIENLKKTFGSSKTAVDGLNAKMYQGEIYALLGHNGAGKTTTISILTGLMSPSGGKATLLGLDIRTEMEEIRKHVGLCPQHNLLFDEMSVLSHVEFFGMLKGLSRKDAKKNSIELLTWLDLSSKLTNKPNQLSGGQKRRVHLAIALIGDTKLAFLDEPSSGLDPETRREVWSILLQLRGKLTCILTTHHMEEADVLGDRIGIMSAGKMVCSGTSSFLKKHYGTGYNLKMGTTSTCHPDEVAHFVQKYVPNAILNKPEGGSIVLSMSLPMIGLDMLKVADLMGALKETKDSLGVNDIGLSLATMDEVFIRAGEADHPLKRTSFHSERKQIQRQSGSALWMNQYLAVFLKRVAHFARAYMGYSVLFAFVAIILLICTTSLASKMSLDPLPWKDKEPSRLISFNDYTSQIITPVYSDGADAAVAANIYSNIVTGAQSVPETFISNFISDLSRNEENYKKKFIIGSAFFKDNTETVYRVSTFVHGLFSRYSVHSAPLAINAISRTLIKLETGVDADIKVTNHPFRGIDDFIHAKDHMKLPYNNLMISLALTLLIVAIMSVLTSMTTLLPIEERLNSGKQLQLMTGMPPIIYWLAMFTYDFLFITVQNIIFTLILLIADAYSGNWLYTQYSAGITFFVILECFTFSSVWFCYLITWAPWVKAPSNGFLMVNIIYITIGIVLEALCVLFAGTAFSLKKLPGRGGGSLETIYAVTDNSKYFYWIIPPANLYQAVNKLLIGSLHNSECILYTSVNNLLNDICTTPRASPRADFIVQCCENCAPNCFRPQPFWGSRSILSYGLIIGDSPPYYESHGIILDLLAMLCIGVIYGLVLIVMECWPPLWARFKGKNRSLTRSNSDNSNIADVDVLEERNRVENIINSDQSEINNQAMIVYNLQAQFKRFVAVNDLSFGVHHGECFGLLGVNGAGKTTTFRMLTGDLFPCKGLMFLESLNFYKNRTEFLASIGYCPQFDGIVGILSGREMVMLFGALRGISYGQLRNVADTWLHKFGLFESADAKCKDYSGGMKRRLSAAMALIGDPKILLMDEPTTGVDPVSRRQFWDILKEIQEGGQSVILTSHTMDECEALCNRLGIMVNGQFQCLGNVQQLKSKFGEGYTLEIKLKRMPLNTNPLEQFEVLNKKILEVFKPCILKDKHDTTLNYRIYNTSLWYTDMFRTMEEVKKSYDVVAEYSIVESSLEDIFISFARHQIHLNEKPAEKPSWEMTEVPVGNPSGNHLNTQYTFNFQNQNQPRTIMPQVD